MTDKKNTLRLTEEERKNIHLYISSPLVSANRLLKNLYSDDKFYKHATYALVSETDAKKMFFYGVAKEVLKVCLGLLSDEEFLEEALVNEDKDVFEKIIYNGIIDNQSQRHRKMLELLTLLILFNNKNSRELEYRIYLAAENLDSFLSRQMQFKSFFGESVANIQHTINLFKERIESDLTTLGVSQIWFLNPIKFKKEQPSVFESIRKLYHQALALANDDEQLALGISYASSYSILSKSSHPVLGSHNYSDSENNREILIANISTISLVCMHVMNMAFKIVGIDDPEGIEKALGKNFDNSNGSQLLNSFRKSYEKGDIVITVYDSLTEIVDIKQSDYGYVAYKVRYLSEPPLPEHPEDWLEAAQIAKHILRKSQIRIFFETTLKRASKVDPNIAEQLLALSNDKLLESGKVALTEMHKQGKLIPALLESGFFNRK